MKSNNVKKVMDTGLIENGHVQGQESAFADWRMRRLRENDSNNSWPRAIWHAFAADQVLQRRHQVTAAEMRALERFAVHGDALSKQDYIFILTEVRALHR